jgi:hypothetical protein
MKKRRRKRNKKRQWKKKEKKNWSQDDVSRGALFWNAVCVSVCMYLCLLVSFCGA